MSHMTHKHLSWVAVALAVLVALIAGAVILAAWRDAKATPTVTPTTRAAQPILPGPFEVAQGTCDPRGLGTELRDDGNTLVINGADSYGDGLPADAMACVLQSLSAPGHVIAQMESTRAFDGRQAATWPGYSASWTYHPDNGLDAIVTAAG